MLIESSNCGAVINLDQVPCPASISLEQWLLSFPSFVFLLSVRPTDVERIKALAEPLDIVCEAIGRITGDRKLFLSQDNESFCFWDLEHDALTGFIKG